MYPQHTFSYMKNITILTLNIGTHPTHHNYSHTDLTQAKTWFATYEQSDIWFYTVYPGDTVPKQLLLYIKKKKINKSSLLCSGFSQQLPFLSFSQNIRIFFLNWDPNKFVKIKNCDFCTKEGHVVKSLFMCLDHPCSIKFSQSVNIFFFFFFFTMKKIYIVSYFSTKTRYGYSLEAPQ